MPELTVAEQLELARSHLKRVQTAAWDPVDWADIGNYGLYALEAAVRAAGNTLGMLVRANHGAKGEIAQKLSLDHGLTDISSLMVELNETRKASNYGDVIAPELNAQDVASQIESFLDEVASLIARGSA